MAPIKNINRKINLTKYFFTFPVRKFINIDKDDIDLETLFLHIERSLKINLYKKISNDLDLLIDEVKANLDDIFPDWIDFKYNKHIDRFYREYELDKISYELTPDDLETIVDSFNESYLESNFDERAWNADFSITCVRILDDLDKDKNIVGFVETDKALNENELEIVKDFLTGELSDNWGEELFEDILEEEIDGINYISNYQCYWNGGFPVWELNIKR
jgi:hypothetical protein